jgi:hypothetical protein
MSYLKRNIYEFDRYLHADCAITTQIDNYVTVSTLSFVIVLSLCYFTGIHIRVCATTARRQIGTISKYDRRVIMRSAILGSAALLTILFSGSAFAGNGAATGRDGFMLNVIAYDRCPAGDFTDSNRHQIAVKADFQYGGADLKGNQGGNRTSTLLKDNTIKLSSSGVDGGFQVLDGNACSKGGAELVIPITDANCGGDCAIDSPEFIQYKVYVRLVGKPGTGIGVTSCALEPDDNDGTTDEYILCSTESVVEMRNTGGDKLRFKDYSKQLLTLCLDTDVDGNLDGQCDDRVALFDSSLEYYFWQWNTKGRAHAQLVFKPVL